MATERGGLLTVRPPGLVDVLDRILDKGLVIAGDVKVSIANVELLTLQIRLLVCSIDKAEQIGLNWWRYDKNLTGRTELEAGTAELAERVAELERALKRQAPGGAQKRRVAPGAARPRQRGAGAKR